jgi:hypothetical protein
MINELWVTKGGRDYFEIRRQYHLEKVMTAGSALIQLKLPDLLKVISPAMRGESFVVKTHSSPNARSWRVGSNKFIHLLITSHRLIPIYLIRDPRDAVLSGFEYGQRALQANKPNDFSSTFRSIESGIDWMENYLQTCWRDWQSFKSMHSFKYEDLLENFDRTAWQLMDYLDIDPASPQIARVLEKYRPGAKPQIGTHFHKGEIGRFRDCLTPQQLDACNQRFAPYLPEMGYPPN